MARQPKFKRMFEKLLRLACRKRVMEQVQERLSTPGKAKRVGKPPPDPFELLR